MPRSGENPRFELLINGNRITIGGFETYGVVSASLGWVSRDPSRYADAQQDNPTLSKTSTSTKVPGSA